MPILDIQEVQSWELGEVGLQIEVAVQHGNIAALLQALLQTAKSQSYVRGFVTWVSAIVIAKEAIGIDLANTSFASPAECKAEHLHSVRTLALERFCDARAALREYVDYSEKRISDLRKEGDHGVVWNAQSNREKLRLAREELDARLKFRAILAVKRAFYEKSVGNEYSVVSQILAGGPAASSPDGIEYSARRVAENGNLRSVLEVSPRMYDLLGWPSLIHPTREEKRFAMELDARAERSQRHYRAKRTPAKKRNHRKVKSDPVEQPPEDKIHEDQGSCDLRRAVSAGNTLALIDGLLYFNSIDLEPPPYLALAAANVLIALYRDGGSLADAGFLSLSDCKAAYRHGRRWRMVQAWFEDIPRLNATVSSSNGRAHRMRHSRRAAIDLAAKASAMAGALLNRSNEDSEATIKKSCQLLSDHPETLEQYWEPSLFLGTRCGFFPSHEEMGKFFEPDFSAMSFKSD